MGMPCRIPSKQPIITLSENICTTFSFFNYVFIIGVLIFGT